MIENKKLFFAKYPYWLSEWIVSISFMDHNVLGSRIIGCDVIVSILKREDLTFVKHIRDKDCKS